MTGTGAKYLAGQVAHCTFYYILITCYVQHYYVSHPSYQFKTWTSNCVDYELLWWTDGLRAEKILQLPKLVKYTTWIHDLD